MTGESETLVLSRLLRQMDGRAPAALRASGHFPRTTILIPVAHDSRPRLILALHTDKLSARNNRITFPNKQHSPRSPSLIFATLHRTRRRVNLPPKLIRIVKPLDPLVSLRKVGIAPCITIVPSFIRCHTGSTRVTTIFDIPLRFFHASPHRRARHVSCRNHD